MVEFDFTALPVGFHDDPYPTYAALREHDPVHRMRDGSIFLTRYADVTACYRSAHASSDKQVEFGAKYGPSPLLEHHTTSLVFNDPPLHTRVRRILMGAVDQRAIRRMAGGVERLVDRLIDAMLERERVDLISAFAASIPIEVIGNLLAMPQADRAPLRDWSLAILGALEPMLDDERRERGNRAVEEFATYLRGLIAHRRAHPLDPNEDALTRLIVGEAGSRAGGAGGEYQLSEHELVHQCIFLLNAGHETTANLIGNGCWLLSTHAAEQARLRADPALLNPAIEEMLRYEGPIQLNNRRLVAPVRLRGQLLPEGTLITLCIGAANRDPAEFDDPERFDVARRPNRHVAFGHGDHACVGMNVARMEARIALGRLLARTSAMELDGPPVRDRRVRFRGFQRLPLRLTPARVDRAARTDALD